MRSIFLLLIFAIATSAQEPPKAVLVDEFETAPCEDVLRRTDSFASELHRDPMATGHIVINRVRDQQRFAEIRRKLVSRFLQLRGLDTDRFRLFLGNEKGGNTQFWLVPAGAEIPIVGYSVFDENKPHTTKPELIGTVDELNICPTFVPRMYAKLLLENPGSIGKVIVEYNRENAKNRWDFAGDWITLLVEYHKIPRNRLRLIFRRATESLNAEFWIVPAKKK